MNLFTFLVSMTWSFGRRSKGGEGVFRKNICWIELRFTFQQQLSNNYESLVGDQLLVVCRRMACMRKMMICWGWSHLSILHAGFHCLPSSSLLVPKALEYQLMPLRMVQFQLVTSSLYHLLPEEVVMVIVRVERLWSCGKNPRSTAGVCSFLGVLRLDAIPTVLSIPFILAGACIILGVMRT